jgi:hypothetical protein
MQEESSVDRVKKRMKLRKMRMKRKREEKVRAS